MATITVGPSDDYATAQAALNACSAGDVIECAAGYDIGRFTATAGDKANVTLQPKSDAWGDGSRASANAPRITDSGVSRADWTNFIVKGIRWDVGGSSFGSHDFLWFNGTGQTADGLVFDMDFSGGPSLLTCIRCDKTGASNSKIQNCLTYNIGLGPVWFAEIAEDCTHVINCSVYQGGASGLDFVNVASGKTLGLLSNNLAFSSGANHYDINGTVTTARNNTSSTTEADISGSAGLVESATLADYFAAAATTMALKSGAPAIGAGYDESAKFTTDAANAARTVPWDRGALELFAAGGIPMAVFNAYQG